jgi:hypothetical protein
MQCSCAFVFPDQTKVLFLEMPSWFFEQKLSLWFQAFVLS